MDIAILTLEYLKVFLDWPLVVFVLCLIFFITYKDVLEKKIMNLIKIKTGKNSLEFKSSQNTPSAGIPPIPEEPKEEDAETYKEAYKELKNIFDELREKYMFERIHAAIRGTQINLLETLEGKNPYENISDAPKYYYDLFIKESKLDVSIEEYLNLLVSMKLIEKKKREEKPRAFPSAAPYIITDLGKKFLKYLREEYPLINPYE